MNIFSFFIKKNIIFVHVPRTGGSSIERHICWKNNFPVVGHDTRKPNYKYLKDRPRLYNKDNFIFTFVRNPWDRLVSAFFYLNEGGGNPKDEKDRKKYLAKYEGNFKKFVKDAFANKKILEQIHFKPQYKWICNNNKELLIDFVGKFENFNKDLDKLSKKLEIELDYPPVSNKSDHKFYRDYYDEETKRIIKNAYKKDVALFNYNF
ncbi:MAG: sulfotransferase family 2 domain-containing protein [Patescibacteria group bacterium]|nr:sulfotransferase family 2 domain-containing protein [Patescibacteria group bacterium]